MSQSAPARGDLPTEAMGFQTTHWTLVLAARAKGGPASQEALASLCSTYWYPLYAFIRRSGFNSHDSEDLTQGFFYTFLRRDSLTRVNPLAGKFRSYLLACLKHYLANERRRTHAQRRGGGATELSLDAATAETRYLTEPSHEVTPEVLFERQWALTVLDSVMAELREEYLRRDKGELFDDLRAFLPGNLARISRGELAARHGLSAGAADVAIHRLRQRFGALLREQVVRTVSSPNEVEEELRYLVSILGT
jgi:DNA-directed RNA polymerase specialized sigma24 family protein